MPAVLRLCWNEADGISVDPVDSRCLVSTGLVPDAWAGVTAFAATAASVAAEAGGWVELGPEFEE